MLDDCAIPKLASATTLSRCVAVRPCVAADLDLEWKDRRVILSPYAYRTVVAVGTVACKFGINHWKDDSNKSG